MLVKIMNLAVWVKPGLFADGLLAFLQSEKTCSLKFAVHHADDFMNELKNKKHAIEIAIIDEQALGFDTKLINAIRRSFKKTKILLIGAGEIFRTLEVLHLGVQGYISRDVNRHYFLSVLKQIRKAGHYFGDSIVLKSTKVMFRVKKVELNSNELHFVRLCCNELTYIQIADIMKVSPRTIDDYRNRLFEKLNIKSRTGLVMFAVSQGIVSINGENESKV